MTSRLLVFQIVLRQLLLLAVSLCVATALFGQSCDGNLGENLFLEGDFGSGVENIPQQDPRLAPGFQYVRRGPPDDGEYTITNNTGLWSDIWQSWLRIPDNSPDPQGYMMIVNASFQPGIFYQERIEGLCENSSYVFSADLINLVNPDATNTYIDPDVTFLINGQAVYSTGDVPRNRRWTTYRFEFETVPGETSVELALQNNAPGGRGNDLAIDNISFRACGPSAQILPLERDVTCENGAPVELIATIDGDQYDDPTVQWQRSLDGGATWENILGETSLSYLHTDPVSGKYYYRYLLSNGLATIDNEKCRVISNEKEIYVQPKFHLLIDTLCEGLFLEVGSSVYDRTGIFVDSLTSFYGCDSIITTKLTIVADTQVESELQVNDPTCADREDGRIEAELPTGGSPPFQYFLDDMILVNGQSITALSGGEYLYRIEDRYGCAFEEQVVVNLPPTFTIDLGQDLSLELGDQARVNVRVSGGVTQAITWTPAEAVVCAPPCTDFALQPTTSLQLLADAVNENGCIATDSILLNVIKVRKHFFPSAFSPNGDGVNDYFTGFGASPNVQLIEELMVANRWGNILYRRTNLQPGDLLSGWDGTARGKPLDEGAYAYTARVLYFDGVVEQVSGEVTLVR